MGRLGESNLLSFAVKNPLVFCVNSLGEHASDRGMSQRRQQGHEHEHEHNRTRSLDHRASGERGGGVGYLNYPFVPRQPHQSQQQGYPSVRNGHFGERFLSLPRIPSTGLSSMAVACLAWLWPVWRGCGRGATVTVYMGLKAVVRLYICVEMDASIASLRTWKYPRLPHGVRGQDEKGGQRRSDMAA